MADKKKCCDTKIAERLNKVGGQAVLEGVMMKAGEKTVTSCRKPDGTIVVYDGEFHSVKKKHKILNIPILRGVVNFVEMLKLSIDTLGKSADAMGINDEPELTEKQKAKREAKEARKLEKARMSGKETKPKKERKEGESTRLTDWIMVISVILGLGLSVLLFIYLPTLLSSLADKYLLAGRLGIWKSVLEGGIKILIFLGYLWLVSLMPDIKRTFMYHGAEHKSIACFEAGAELTPESAKKYKRFHPRCGTSFMFIMILIGIFAGLFVRILFSEVIGIELPNIAYFGIRLLILPIVMGIGYEIIMLAGKHDNFVTRALSAPGLWVQRITTKEPTEDMLEVAITSIKCALRDDFPEFAEFYNERAWEKKPCAEAKNAECEITPSEDEPEQSPISKESAEDVDNA